MMAVITALLVMTQAQVQWWCSHGLHNVFPDTPKPPDNSQQIRVSAARNQTVGAQIVLRADSQNRVEMITCSALRGQGGRGSVPATAFRYSFVEYHRVNKNSSHTPKEELVREAPADFPDAFLEEKAVNLAPERNQPVYVQWRVPANTPAGLYIGEISVRLQSGTIRVPVSLTVYDFTFPERTRLLVTNWTNPTSLASFHNVEYLSEAYWRLLQRTASLMREHHQNVIFTPWSLIRATRGAEGQLRFDFTNFDRWVEIFLKEGFERIELHHVGGREHGQWEDKTFIAWPLECRNEGTGQIEWLPLEQWLPALHEHLRQKGWIERTLLHVADEPIEVNVDSWKQLAERAKRLAPDLRRIDAIHVPNLRGYLEVWVPQLNFLEKWQKQFRLEQARGSEMWFYVAWVPQGRYPNRLIDYPLIKTRVMHWMNFLTDTTGFLHWGYNFWGPSFEEQLAPGDNWIVYPGKEAPRSSLRYEAMREGIEDYEYLCLLQDAAKRVAQRLGAVGFDTLSWVKGYTRLVAPDFQNYTRDAGRLYRVRDAVARAIVALEHKNLPLLAWCSAYEDGRATIQGVTVAGARISVGDVSTTANSKGNFEVRVPCRDVLLTVDVRKGRTRNTLPVAISPQ